MRNRGQFCNTTTSTVLAHGTSCACMRKRHTAVGKALVTTAAVVMGRIMNRWCFHCKLAWRLLCTSHDAVHGERLAHLFGQRLSAHPVNPEVKPERLRAALRHDDPNADNRIVTACGGDEGWCSRAWRREAMNR